MEPSKQTNQVKLTSLQNYFVTFRNLLVFAETYAVTSKSLEEGGLGFKQKLETKGLNKTAKISIKPEFAAVASDIRTGKIANPIKVLAERGLYLSDQLNKAGLKIPDDDSLETWIVPGIDFNKKGIVKARFLESVTNQQEREEMSDKTKKNN